MRRWAAAIVGGMAQLSHYTKLIVPSSVSWLPSALEVGVEESFRRPFATQGAVEGR